MKIDKIFIISIIFLAVFAGYNLAQGIDNIHDYTGESIQYLIRPIGKTEYNNFGTVDLNGTKVNLVTLKIKILFVEITEKIFSDPKSLLPYKIERTTSGLWSKEYRTEEYDQKEFTVLIKKFKGEKLVKEQMVKSNSPIQNVIPLLFYLRKQPDLEIGWCFSANIIDELKVSGFDMELLSIGEITVPAGKFQAYHFKSIPPKFEIWIKKGTPQVPLKIKLKGIVDCSILMDKYNFQ